MAPRKPTAQGQRDEFGLDWDLPDDWDQAEAQQEAAESARHEPTLDLPGPKPTPIVRRTDPREKEEWFVRLPEDEQQRIRERWKWEGKRFGDWDKWHARRRRNSIRNGALMFGFVQFLQWGAGWHLILIATLLGGALGELWHRMRADRIVRVVTAVPLYFLIQGLAGIGRSGTMMNPAPVMFMLYGGLAISVLACASGLLSEREEYDGPNG